MFFGLDQLRVPTTCPPAGAERIAEFAAEGRNVQDYMDSQQARLDKLTGKGVRRSAKIIEGRGYNPVTGFAREIRPLMTIGGERVVECDLHASYWCWLVSMLRDGDEKQGAILTLQSDWYRQFDYSCLPAGAANYKVEFQKQCLFGRDKRNESNPLRGQLRKKYPKLSGLIARRLKQHGASRLAKMLMRMEGKAFIHGAMVELHSMGIPTIGNHDGLICRVSDIETVRKVLLRHLTQHLGFTPKVKIKCGVEIEPCKAAIKALDALNSNLATAT